MVAAGPMPFLFLFRMASDARLSFPPSSDWLSNLSDCQSPARPGPAMGKRKRTKDKSESSKGDASSLLPQVSTPSRSPSAWRQTWVHICRKDITGSAHTRILSPTTTSSTPLLRTRSTGAYTIPHSLVRGRSPSLRMWDVALAACSSPLPPSIPTRSC